MIISTASLTCWTLKRQDDELDDEEDDDQGWYSDTEEENPYNPEAEISKTAAGAVHSETAGEERLGKECEAPLQHIAKQELEDLKKAPKPNTKDRSRLCHKRLLR